MGCDPSGPDSARSQVSLAVQTWAVGCRARLPNSRRAGGVRAPRGMGEHALSRVPGPPRTPRSPAPLGNDLHSAPLFKRYGSTYPRILIHWAGEGFRFPCVATGLLRADWGRAWKHAPMRSLDTPVVRGVCLMLHGR